MVSEANSVRTSATIYLIAGTLGAFAVMCPYLGRLGGIPMRTLTPVALAALFWIARSAVQRMPPRLIVFNLMLLAITLLVLASASGVHIHYLFSLENWLRSPTEYYDSKLLVFLIGMGPPAFIMIFASCLNDYARGQFIRGALIGFILVGALSLLRLSLDWQFIFTSNIGEAWDYLANGQSNGRDFSMVSFGAILAASSAASLGFFGSNLWKALLMAFMSALFLCGVFVVNQRSNFLFTSVTLAAALAVLACRREALRSAVVSVLAVFAVVTAFTTIAANPAHVGYWGEFGGAAQTRLDIVVSAFGYSMPERLPDDISNLPELDVPQANSTPVYSEAKNHPTGLGAFAMIDHDLLFPHNILAELWIEVGAVSAILFSFLIVGWAYYALRRELSYRTARAAAATAVGLVIVLHSMKSGDLGFLGTIAFSLWLTLALPETEQDSMEVPESADDYRSASVDPQNDAFGDN